MAKLTDVALACCVLHYQDHLGLIAPDDEVVRTMVEKSNWFVENMNENYSDATSTLDTEDRETLWDIISQEYLHRSWPSFGENANMPAFWDQLVAASTVAGWKLPDQILVESEDGLKFLA